MDFLGLENLIQYKVQYAVSLVANVFEVIEKHPYPGFENVQSKMVQAQYSKTVQHNSIGPSENIHPKRSVYAISLKVM